MAVTFLAGCGPVPSFADAERRKDVAQHGVGTDPAGDVAERIVRGVRRGDVHILPHTSGERLWRAKRFLPHKLYSNLFQRSLGRMKPRGQR